MVAVLAGFAFFAGLTLIAALIHCAITMRVLVSYPHPSSILKMLLFPMVEIRLVMVSMGAAMVACASILSADDAAVWQLCLATLGLMSIVLFTLWMLLYLQSQLPKHLEWIVISAEENDSLEMFSETYEENEETAKQGAQRTFKGACAKVGNGAVGGWLTGMVTSGDTPNINKTVQTLHTRMLHSVPPSGGCPDGQKDGTLCMDLDSDDEASTAGEAATRAAPPQLRDPDYLSIIAAKEKATAWKKAAERKAAQQKSRTELNMEIALQVAEDKATTEATAEMKKIVAAEEIAVAAEAAEATGAAQEADGMLYSGSTVSTEKCEIVEFESPSNSRRRWAKLSYRLMGGLWKLNKAASGLVNYNRCFHDLLICKLLYLIENTLLYSNNNQYQ